MAPTRPLNGWAHRTTRFVALSLALLSSTARAATARSFPYVPTQVLLSGTCVDDSNCHGKDVAYILSPGAGGASDVEFLSLDYSKGVDGNAQPKKVTEDTLPFLKDAGKTTAFGAVRTDNGTMVVYAGDCDGGVGDVWNYAGDDAGWVKKDVTDDAKQDDEGGKAPYFLGGTIAFSAGLAPERQKPTIYTYGGMCPAPNSTEQTWQSAANYTKAMLSLSPPDNQGGSDLSLNVASYSGPRTPIAGFTLTGLTPSVSNVSGTISQQAGFVVLGGHTQQAFINMSTAAVWNLPAESWTYIGIQPPDGSSGRTGGELAVKNVKGGGGSEKRASGDLPDNVYSRSGHTAVLSADGSSIVVLGGWVGDVNTPAEPQLAVLEMSQTYSSWQWKIPVAQPDGEGIYGHGAALLPGNVMFVYGGWETKGSGSSKVRRQAGGSSLRFLNLDSMEWSTSYTNPNGGDSSPGSNSGSGSGTGAGTGAGTSKKTLGLGLGLGLGIGLALLLAVLVALFFLRRRHKRRQEESRDTAARALAQDATYFAHPDEMAERDDFFPWGVGNGWYTGGQGNHQTGERSLGYESLRGSRDQGLTGYPPGGMVRKPMTRQLRGGYVPADARMGNYASPPGQIHPILEDDEEDYLSPMHRHNRDDQTPLSEAPSDPFLTPSTATVAPVLFPPGRGSATPSPDGIRRTDPEVQDWVCDVDAADTLLARFNQSRQQGRLSPTRRNSHRSSVLKDDESLRTGSNLSESNRSAADSLWRSISGRKPNNNASASGNTGPFGLAAHLATEQQKPGSSSSSSYNTAKSGFGALQAEAPGLLLGHAAPSSPTYDEFDVPGSPSKSKPRRGWLGSLRRVFNNSEDTSPNSSARDESPRRDSMERLGGDYEQPPLVGLSGELLKRKQGRQDWGDLSGGPSVQVANNEWDIERAVESRLVQVMFTVPKERLRVVNADDEGDVGDGSMEDEEERRVIAQPQTAELVNPSSSGSSRDMLTPDGERGRERERDREREREMERERDDEDHEEDGLLRVDEAEGRRSHSSDGTGRRSSGAVFTAEAMTIARPQTRVLRMVDSIESKSKESSPVRESRVLQMVDSIEARSKEGSPVRERW